MSSTPSSPSRRASRYAVMNGIGNAILVVDRRDQAPLDGDAARRLHRDFAFDQLMAIGNPRDPASDAFVDIFNADGSRAGACGNGTRCVAWFLLEGTARSAVTVETAGGPLACRRDGPTTFTVDMGAPRFGWRDIPLREAVPDTSAFAIVPAFAGADTLGPCSALSMGNPHAVFFPADASGLDLAAIGPALGHHPLFPDQANVSLATVLAPDSIALRVWERGAGLTLACGSAACAALVAGVRRGLVGRSATITLPGGMLEIAWRPSDDHVLMSGPVALDARGEMVAA